MVQLLFRFNCNVAFFVLTRYYKGVQTPNNCFHAMHNPELQMIEKFPDAPEKGCA